MYLNRKFPFWVFKRCSLADFEYKKSFGKVGLKLQNDLFGFKFAFQTFKSCSFKIWALVLFILSIKNVLSKYR